MEAGKNAEDLELGLSFFRKMPQRTKSGSGKSTIAALLQNLYPLKKGKIRIGEHDIKHLSIHSLRRLIAVVPQQIDLFSGNVIENIALGEEFPDLQLVMEVTKRTGILPFVEKLPGGFQTYLGENGAFLSGGERQRIAIARALYRQPEILILDEATSALDTASERTIQQAFSLLKEQGKTLIVIAHRLSTIVQSDKIMVLKEGKVIEEGSHRQLLQREDSVYKDMWKKQGKTVPLNQI